MDDLERRITETLVARGDGSPPPDDGPARVLRQVASRRRRRRYAAIAGVALAAATALTVPTVLSLRSAQDDPAARGTAPLSSAPSPLSIDLKALVDTDGLVTIGRKLPGGWRFDAEALGEDGTVLGRGLIYDGQDDSGDTKVWRTGPGVSAPHAVVNARSPVDLGGMAVEGSFVYWLEHRDDLTDFQLMCRDKRGGSPRQMGTGGVTAGSRPLVSHGVVVWADAGDGATDSPVKPRIWRVSGCTDPPRQVATNSVVEAFSYPHAFVRKLADRGELSAALTEVNIETGKVVTTHTLPQQDVAVTANRGAVVWGDGVTLTVTDRRSQRPRRIAGPLRPGENEVTGLSAGNRLVVYTVSPMDNRDPDAPRSLVYDLRTGRAVVLPGEAYAAGDRLLWRDGDWKNGVYRLARVR